MNWFVNTNSHGVSKFVHYNKNSNENHEYRITLLDSQLTTIFHSKKYQVNIIFSLSLKKISLPTLTLSLL